MPKHQHQRTYLILLGIWGFFVYMSLLYAQDQVGSRKEYIQTQNQDRFSVVVLNLIEQNLDFGSQEKAKIDRLKKIPQYSPSMPILKEAQHEELQKQEKQLKEKQKLIYVAPADQVKLIQTLRSYIRNYPNIDLIDDTQMLELVEDKKELASHDEALALQIGSRLGAHWMIWPKLVQVGQHFRLELRIYDLTQKKELAQYQAWGKNINELLKQQEVASKQIIARAIIKYYQFASNNITTPPVQKIEQTELPKRRDDEFIDKNLSFKLPKDPDARMAWELYLETEKELNDKQNKLIDNYKNQAVNKENVAKILEEELKKDWDYIRRLTLKVLGPKEERLKKEIPSFFDMEIPLEQLNQESDPMPTHVDHLDSKFLKEKLLQLINKYEAYPFAAQKVEVMIKQFTWIDQQIEFVKVHGGSFLIGSSDNIEDEWPIQWVTVKPFLVGISEVTNAQYQKCVDEKACTSPHWYDGKCQIFSNFKVNTGVLPDQWQRGDMPVVCVDWHQALKFAKWANARLLSEAEWEYIGRNSEKSYIYPWGKDEPTCEYAVMESSQGDSGCGLNQVWPICSKPLGFSSIGVCDLAGNVWEWVMDSYRPDHEKVPTDASPVLGGNIKVMRGGSFTSSVKELRASTRGQAESTFLGNFVGFRIARDL